MSGTTGDSRVIVLNLLKCLQSNFQNSTSARQRAWDKLTSTRGKESVQKLINNPKITLNHFGNFLTFKEWLSNET